LALSKIWSTKVFLSFTFFAIFPLNLSISFYSPTIVLKIKKGTSLHIL